jgi:hypothetical protein
VESQLQVLKEFVTEKVFLHQHNATIAGDNVLQDACMKLLCQPHAKDIDSNIFQMGSEPKAFKIFHTAIDFI